MSLLEKMLWNDQPHIEHLGDKVSIIGAGMVGMAIANSMLGTGVTRNLVLVDAFEDRVKGEVMDLQHGSLFLKHPRIRGGKDFSLTQGSKICVVTVGTKKEPGETRLALAQKNANLMVKIIPQIMKYSPDTTIIIVGNPCDAMTYIAWKCSGLPSHKVIGAGTVLDTQRFKVALAKKFKINPANVHAYIIGEQGVNSIAVWSSVNIGGLRMKRRNPKFGTKDDPENWNEIHKDVIGATEAIQQLKGYANWGVGMSIAAVAKALLTNRLAIFPVSVNANGKYGIEHDVYIAVPAVLGSNGVTDVVHLNLNEKDLHALQHTARILKQIQDNIKLKPKELTCKCRRCDARFYLR